MGAGRCSGGGPDRQFDELLGNRIGREVPDASAPVHLVEPALVENTVDAYGNGIMVYYTEYCGGTLWLNGYGEAWDNGFDHYEAIGYPVVAVSAKREHGLDPLRRRLDAGGGLPGAGSRDRPLTTIAPNRVRSTNSRNSPP